MRNRLSGCSATKLVGIESRQHNLRQLASPEQTDRAEWISLHAADDTNHISTGLSEKKRMLQIQQTNRRCTKHGAHTLKVCSSWDSNNNHKAIFFMYDFTETAAKVIK